MLLAGGVALLLLLWVLELWRRAALASRALPAGVLRDKEGRVQGVCVVQPCPPGLEFAIRRETGYDTLATGLGLAREPSLGVRALDQDLYLETDDALVVRRLAEDPDVLRQLRALFERPRFDGWRLLRVDCANGQLVARATCRSEPAARRAAARFESGLAAIARVLHGAARNGGDPLPGRARALLALPGACTLLAFTGLALWGLFEYRLLEPWGLLLATLPWSLSAGALYLLLCVRAMRHGARAHLVLLEGGALVLAGFIGCGYWGAYLGNRELDHAGVQEVVWLEGEYVWSWHSCRDGHCVTLTVPEWRPGRGGGHHEIAVTKAEGARLLPFRGPVLRDPVAVLEVRAGALGFPWVDRVVFRERDRLRDARQRGAAPGAAASSPR